ncbi:Heme exporter protein C [bacterium HR21]|jgi:heme exporter protein C|nr:Heme exporter protein C [bacterium HR21]
MKYLLLAVGLGGGLLLALLYPPERPRPMWWQVTVITVMGVLIVAALAPPIGGTFADAVYANRWGTLSVPSLLSVRERERFRGQERTVPVVLRCVSAAVYDTALGLWSVWAEDDSPRRVLARVLFPTVPSEELLRARRAIVELEWTGTDTLWIAQRVRSLEPFLVLPYIPGLGERARILYFHVPLAWIAVFAYAIAALAALRYLRRRDLEAESRAVAAAALGTLFAVLATATGAIWARFNWGAFWNWDPRQTTIVVLLLIYLAYFVLRGSLPEGERRARLGSVYLLFAFVAVPVLVFILPRMMESLHPGGKGDVTIGPVLDPNPEALDTLKQVLFSGSLLAFTALFGWLWSLGVRVVRLTELVRWHMDRGNGVSGEAR